MFCWQLFSPLDLLIKKYTYEKLHKKFEISGQNPWNAWEGVHMLVKLQVVVLQLYLKWTPSYAFLKDFEHRFMCLLLQTIFLDSYFLNICFFIMLVNLATFKRIIISKHFFSLFNSEYNAKSLRHMF